MSYCRFSEGDIYLFPHTAGYIICQCCTLAEKVKSIFTTGDTFFGIKPCECGGVGCDRCMMHGDTHLATPKDALEHVKQHRERGDFVPEHVDAQLLREIADSPTAPAPMEVR